MNLTFNENLNRFEMICTFYEKDIPKEAGFNWDPKAKKWNTASAICADRVIKYADLPTRRKIAENLINSVPLDSSIQVPTPDGVALYPYQRAAVEFCSKRKSSLIADETGTGKTAEAIGLINYLDIDSGIIICPSYIKLHWKRELEKWLHKKFRIVCVSGKSIFDITFFNFVILNYDIVCSWLDELSKRKWPILICDESHCLKNGKAKRSKCVMKLAKRCDKKILLTGTPILNRPVELFNQLKILGHDLGKNYWKFVHRYCNAYQDKWGLKVDGSSHLDELSEIMYRDVIIRRLKSQVLKDLPEKVRQVIELDGDKYSAFVKQNDEIRAGYVKEKRMLKRKAKKSMYIKNLDDYKELGNKLRSLEIRYMNEISVIRHKTALAKVDDVVEHVSELLGQGQKIVVFAHHRDVVDKITEDLHLYTNTVLKITGATSMEDRDKIVREFQKNEFIRVFVGSIHATGMGISLTAANVVVFAELDWTPSRITQCEDRLWRIHQKKSVLVQHLIVDGSIDAKMVKIMIRKQEILDKLNLLDSGEVEKEVALDIG